MFLLCYLSAGWALMFFFWVVMVIYVIDHPDYRHRYQHEHDW